MTFKRMIFLICVALAIFLGGCLIRLFIGFKSFGDAFYGDNYHYAEHCDISQIDAQQRDRLYIPLTAKDISYGVHNNISGQRYSEFNLSEGDFIKYAEDHQRHYERMTHPMTIRRYTDDIKSGIRKNQTSITNGYFYIDRKPNGGGVTMIYDSDHHKVYIDASSR